MLLFGDQIQNISTGKLPSDDVITHLINSAYHNYKDNQEGKISTVYPAFAAVTPSLFGLCMVDNRGKEYSVGDVRTEFTMMSISKPFIFALLCQRIGAREAREKLGVNSTGKAFNSVAAIEVAQGGKTNPMVNPGAIASTSFIPGKNDGEKWEVIYQGLSAFAGRQLPLNDEIYSNALQTNFRNRGIANVLEGMGLLGCDAMLATELYTRQCCLNITAYDLAVMGATLADGGVNPVTGQRVVDNDICHYTLAVMATAGLYETSGEWLYEVGLPAKSGIGGGIIGVAPGKGGLATFAPLLDAVGNSVKGQLAMRSLSRGLGLDLFLSEPYFKAEG